MSPDYKVIVLAVFLIGAGSIGYHLAPGNETFVLFRRPSSLSVVCLIAAVFRERIDQRWGQLKFAFLTVFIGPGRGIPW